MNSESAVFSNLHDSVSRIVDNFQFTHIEEAAHSRLIGLVMDKLTVMSDTCRALLENSGRTGSGLNVNVDLKYLFRMHRVDLHDLVEYTQQVGAFPPRAFEIHGDENSESARRAHSARLEMENSKKKLLTTKMKNPTLRMRHPTPPVYSLPIYDDMSPSDLGFHDDSSSSSDEAPPPFSQAPPPAAATSTPPTYLSPPPPPPPIPPLLSYFSESPTSPETLYNIPSFDPQVPPPSYSNPPEPVVRLKLFKADPPLAKPPPSVEKWSRLEKSRVPRRLPEKRKIEVPAAVAPPKMTRKRLMQTNYERRLRQEQMAAAERRKEKQAEMKWKQKEKLERMMKTSHVETPRKFKERLPKKNPRVEADGNPQSKTPTLSAKDENDNYTMIQTPAKFQKFTSSESLNPVTTSSERVTKREAIGSRAPLPKIRVYYKDARQGRLIRKVETTEFYDVKGAWKPKVRTWQNKQGIFSKTIFPNGSRRQRCGSITLPDSPKISEFSRKMCPKIPKLKLVRNSDNSYSRVL